VVNAQTDIETSAGVLEATPGPKFAEEAGRVMERLRRALAGVLVAAPEGAVSRAADLRRWLDLDSALAWQVHTIATGDDALRAARNVPKAGAMERFLEAAAKSGAVGASVVEEVRGAYEAFERLVTEQAGRRENFDAMIAALRPQGSALQRIRRTAYRANAAVWGVTVRCALNCVVFYQRPTGEHDCLSVRGRIGVRRLQEGAVVGIYASGRTWGGAECPPVGAPKVAVDPCELLEECCSTPAPRIRRVESPDGSVRDYLELEGLGRSSEVTILWRNLSLNFPDGTTTPPHGCSVPCLEPTEVSVMDLLIPQGWTDPRTAEAWQTLASSPYAMPGSEQPGHRLPFECEVKHLGTRPEQLYTPHEPRYSEVIARQLQELGWPLGAFDIYRCEVKYPVLHAAVHLCVHGAR